MSKHITTSPIITAWAAQYNDAELSPAVKERVDRTIERYGVGKSLLELHALSFGLLFKGMQKQTKKKTDHKRRRKT